MVTGDEAAFQRLGRVTYILYISTDQGMVTVSRT